MDEKTKIALDKATYTTMRGTMGDRDYIMLAVKDGVALGVKPLIHFESNCTKFALRVRSAPLAGSVPGLDEEPIADIEKMESTWPKFDFKKQDTSRCSLVTEVVVNRNLKAKDELIDSMSSRRVVSKLIASLVTNLPEGTDLVIDEEQLFSVLQHAWKTFILLAYEANKAHINSLPDTENNKEFSDKENFSATNKLLKGIDKSKLN